LKLFASSFANICHFFILVMKKKLIQNMLSDWSIGWILSIALDSVVIVMP
jgi:hypothetical protein